MWIVNYVLCIASLIKLVVCKQPHILLIVADDLGWNDIGYHNSDVISPTLDDLAGRSVKLENYYTQSICTPSRSQLLTGRYQIHTGLQHLVILHGQPNGLPLQFPTLADKLKEVGYRTHIAGKWHLGFFKKDYWPTNRGFDSFLGMLAGAGDHYTHSSCFDFSDHNACGLDLHDNYEPVWDKNGSYSTEIFAERAIEIVRDHAVYHRDKPLFLYLPFQAVHTPLEVPERYIHMYHHIEDVKRKTYLGMVTAMDEAVRRVIEEFQQHRMWDDTLTLFTTDNGGRTDMGASNYPLKGAKETLWEGGIRAVGFVHGQMLGGRHRMESTHELIHISDWFPTLLSVAGASYNEHELDGFNVWDTICCNEPSPRHEILHNIDPLARLKGFTSKSDIFDTRQRAAIRMGDWKLLTGNPYKSGITNDIDLLSASLLEIIMNDSKEPWDKNVWLYNIKEDPYEEVDLSDVFPGVVDVMLSRLAQYNSTAVPVTFPPNDDRADPTKHGGVWTSWLD